MDLNQFRYVILLQSHYHLNRMKFQLLSNFRDICETLFKLIAESDFDLISQEVGFELGIQNIETVPSKLFDMSPNTV